MRLRSKKEKKSDDFFLQAATLTADATTRLVMCRWCGLQLLPHLAADHFDYHHIQANNAIITERAYSCPFCKAEFFNEKAFDQHLVADMNALRVRKYTNFIHDSFFCLRKVRSFFQTCQSFDVPNHPIDRLEDLQKSPLFKIPVLSWDIVAEVLVRCDVCDQNVEMRNLLRHTKFHLSIMRADDNVCAAY